MGDLDGDGRAELAVGLPAENRVVIYRWLGGAAVAMDLPNAGALPGARFGAAVAPAGDVNGDGLGDLLVGEPGGDAQPGRVLLYLGDAASVVAPDARVVQDDRAGARFGAAAACC